jgi:hypothetical protein
MTHEHGKPFRQAVNQLRDAVKIIHKNIDEHTDGPFEMRYSTRNVDKQVEVVDTEGEILLALVDDLIVSLGRVRQQRDDAIRQARAAMYYVRNRDYVELNELVYLIAEAGYPQLADQVAKILSP